MADKIWESSASFTFDVLRNSDYLAVLANEITKGNAVYIKTYGFDELGDGGAAYYKAVAVPEPTTEGQAFDNGTTVCYSNGCFWAENSSVAFELLPQGNSIYAEQFGILPFEETAADFDTKIAYNSIRFNQAIKYANEKGKKLTFSSPKKRYFLPENFIIYTNTYIDGDAAILFVSDKKSVADNSSDINFFVCSDTTENVTIKNISLVGRKKSAIGGYEDQAFKIRGRNFTTENVNISQFSYAYHSGHGGVEENFLIPEPSNYNWLIENCHIKNTVTDLMLSEIDGIIIKNSDIFSYFATKLDHCAYLSSNCSNIRINGCRFAYSNGGAIHKHYPAEGITVDEDIPNIYGDGSHNQFYTDLAMHDVETAWLFGLISENTMCDSNLVTHVNRLLVTIGLSNCIISNCDAEQTRQDISGYNSQGKPIYSHAFLTAKEAARFWMQNSKIYYQSAHRISDFLSLGEYYKIMSDSRLDRRDYIGINRNVANLAYKFTGCTMVNRPTEIYYFNRSSDNLIKTEEYWDNCLFDYKSSSEIVRLPCLTHIPSGLTFRNSYIINQIDYDSTSSGIKAPFRFICTSKNCTCLSSEGCSFGTATSLPWLRLENVVLDNAFYRLGIGWKYIINTYDEATTKLSYDYAVNISNSYAHDCYRVLDGNRIPINRLMRVE